ncbi:MAG: endonuclease [Bacilli bacterium]|nr:endonuclease [Bacilli bacterium]
MKKKITTLFKISLGISLLGGGIYFGAKNDTREAIPVKADATSYWSSVNSDANADTLFNKLYSLINSNTVSLGYDGLWDAYEETDLVPHTNKVWDMYGGFQFSFQSGGKSYSKEGDCYNREHSVPKSWWGKTEDERYCDIIHLVPTDGYVNNRRSNYAFGEVSSASYNYSFPERKDGNGNVAQKAGTSKLGVAKAINGVSYPGGSGSPVFEPDDQYKGDFARIYYYFATRYGPKGKIATQGDGARMFSNDSNNFYMTAYGKALMNKWHVQDPVSQKEIDRNDGVEATQKNRNPYVDHPEWADKIFGSNYAAVHGGGTVNNDPTLSVVASSTTMKVGESVTLTAYTQNTSGVVQWYIEDYSTDVISLSSTTGNSITVNGLAEGTKKVWAYIGTLSDSVTINVSSTGSTLINEDDGTIIFGKNNVQINSTNVTGVDSLGNSWTIKTEGTTSFTPNNNYYQVGSSSNPASSISFSMDLGECKKITDFTINLGGFSGTAGTVTLKVDDFTVGTGSLKTTSDVNIKASDATKSGSKLTATITGISKGVKAYSISYSFESSSVVNKSLTDITLSTNNVKTVFNVGDDFTYSGLVVNAIYSNNTTKVVTPTSVSSPDMSSSGTKVITVSYTEDGVTKSDTYQITVNAGTSVPTYITACSTKTYYVGDTISTDDLYVEDNLGNEIDEFYFSDDGYQFTYDDAVSGGDLTDKVFSNSVTFDDMTCSLTVVVQRKERTEISSKDIADTLTAEDFVASDTNYKDFDNVTKTSKAIYKGQSAKTSTGGIQLRSKNNNSGIVSSSTGGVIKSFSITVESGSKTLDVYAKNEPYASASDLYGSNQGTKVGSLSANGTIDFSKLSKEYTYIGIRSNDGAIYLTSIEIAYKGTGEDTAINVANYIMHSDEEGQCQTKFEEAKLYFEHLSKAERTTFMTSNDYVISSARERLEAWATYLGKSISYEDGDYVISNAIYQKGVADSLNSNETKIVLITVLVSCVSLFGGLYLFKRKRLSK